MSLLAKNSILFLFCLVELSRNMSLELDANETNQGLSLTQNQVQNSKTEQNALIIIHGGMSVTPTSLPSQPMPFSGKTSWRQISHA